MKYLIPSAAVVVALSVTTLAQTASQDPQQQQPPPTFRTSVDLVPVDVNVIDRTGRPVSDLAVGDFVLMVDGKPRRIVSAEYIPTARDVAPAPPAPTYYSTNASAAGGRQLMVVVDQGNIGAGRGKQVLDAAARFISRLTPADRVGLVAIPGAGPQIDFTANHAIVRSLLPKLVGQAAPFVGQYRIGVAEAYALERGDTIAVQQILDRECTGFRTADEIEMCRRALQTEAQGVYSDARARTQNSLTALRFLIERLAQTPSPKTVVFISEGLVIERDFSDLTWLGPAAGRGQVVLYVIQLDTPQFDASSSRSSPSRLTDVDLGEEGLGMLAGITRGSVLRVVSNADSAFSRLALELSGYYLLGFEPEPGDRDGKSHKIKIEVPGRKGVEIRARTEFTVDPPATKTDEDRLADTLRAPLLTSDIPLKLSTYTMRDPETGRLRVLLATEIDRSLNPTAQLSIAYALIDARGKVVSSRIESDVKGTIRPATRTQQFIGAALAESPGVHTVKLAVIDSTGKQGSVEHTFRAQLTAAGQIRATDLLIAENVGAASGGVLPAVTGEFTSDMLHGYIELYSDAPEGLSKAKVTIEVAEDERSRTLEGAAARLQPATGEGPNRVTAEAALPIALLPPGEYVARAVISIDDTTAATVVRPFKIARSAATTSAAGSRPGSAVRPPIPFTSRIDAFDRRTVLTPQVVGFFLDRMNVGARGESPAAPAMDLAREGRFDAALEALKQPAQADLAATFIHGLALYARGDLEAAAVKFRESVRIDPEFFPAAFYLGSCYAAGGRDREAANAWQTSLVTESDAPFIYTLLGDALLRLRDVDRALDILKEASSLWPDNEQVQLRLGTALSLNGQQAEALRILEGYLEKHPEDAERQFVALRTIYEAAAAGKPIKSAAEDRALFEKYAVAYAAANGPSLAMVEQWKKFLDKR